jgi:hypothetical protein
VRVPMSSSLQLTGDHSSATASLEQALRLYRQSGDQNGACCTRDGREAEGRQLLNEALALYQSLGSPHAERLAAALEGRP